MEFLAAILLLAGVGVVAVYTNRDGKKLVEDKVKTTVNKTEETIEKVISFIAHNSPRGIRNNNPGNIERGDNWRGLSAKQTDKRYAQFDDPKFGIRAMSRILDTYAQRNINTIEGIIATWAPNNENDTESYILSVALQMDFHRGMIIPRARRADLIAAIIMHENGQQPYPMALIREGISLA